MNQNQPTTNGCVYLVGAGPGDPGLITVRGKELLSQADVIIYDYLASDLLLQYARPEAKLIYVGKQGGDHTLPQSEINALIIEQARQHQIVVRLKGGDPFVFGRGGEEALELSQAGIRFEVVPGISAGIAAPAYAGIPVTHRDYASDFALITGHEAADREGSSQIDWPTLGRWKGTLAFYMGVKNLPDICQNLVTHGMAPDTPAAIIRWGTTPQQRTITGTITTLSELVAKAGIKPPAIILVGQVVKLRCQLNWYETRPLFGQRIVVTRARSQASGLLEKLHGLGAQTIEFPAIKIIPPADPQPLLEAIARLNQYHWIIFTSVNGVDSFFDHLAKSGRDSRALGTARICAIGPATAEQLRRYGIKADLIPTEYVAEAVFQEITAVESIKGKRMLLPRADQARKELPQDLAAAGALVDEVIAYQTVPDEGPRLDILNRIEQNEVDWMTFASSSTVKNFFSQIDPKIVTTAGIKLASIGPITSATLREFGLQPQAQAAVYTIDGLITAILGHYHREP